MTIDTGAAFTDTNSAIAQSALRESEARFRAFVNASTDVVYRMSPDWTQLRELDGRGFLASASNIREDWIEDYVFAEDQVEVRAAIAKAIRERKMFMLEHRVRRLDGSVGWTLSRAVPIFDDRGEILEWFGAASDVTERHRAQGALAQLTKDSDRQKRFYETLIASTPDLIYAFDLDYRFTFANRALLDMWGRTLEESIGKRLTEVGYEPWHAEMHEREIDEVIATRAGIRGEIGFTHATLGRRTYDYIFMPMFNARGEVEGIAGTTRDITDIKRAEEHLRLLVNELNHRVKNTLATIQSIAAQTFRGDAAAPGARAAFEGRLIALSNAHSVLTGTNWEGASLTEIVRQALAPFADGAEPERLSVDGVDRQLPPQGALSLAMALHELASNAVKYGAWSTPGGKVAIQWKLDEGRLWLEWRECDGPAIAPPSRHGFGTRLLKQGLARELDGEVTLEYPITGAVCRISMPSGGAD